MSKKARKAERTHDTKGATQKEARKGEQKAKTIAKVPFPEAGAYPVSIEAEVPAKTYPDVDPNLDAANQDVDAVGSALLWSNPLACVTELERQAKVSHGLTPDVELLKKTARYLRQIFDLLD